MDVNATLKAHAPFAERLRAVVDLVGNAEILAEKSGVSRRLIGKYLAGETAPSYEKTGALADASGIAVKWLVTGKGPMIEEPVTGPPLDEDFLALVIAAVEGAAEPYGAVISAQHKAKVIHLVYTIGHGQDAFSVGRLAARCVKMFL